MSYSFTLTDIVPASPQAVYAAWLSSRAHSAMTGGKAMQSAKVDAKFTAWNGYITGKNLKLVPGKRIVQSWRTTKFTPEDADSTITVTLAAVSSGTRLTLRHANVPDDHTNYERGGWQANYFEPMKKFFAKIRATPAKPRSKAKHKARRGRSGRKTGASRKSSKR